MKLVIGIIVVLCIGLASYIVFLQWQIRNINRQLDIRLTKQTRQPVSLELFNRDLNKLTANINRSLKIEQTLRLDSIREEKRFKELIANISHDLRTPLTAIKGYQQHLEKGKLFDDQRKKLKVAQKYADELGNLIEQFFEYSYLLNREAVFEMERLNLTNLVTECIVESITIFEEKQLKVSFKEVSPIFVLANREMIVRIIQNLLRNCVQHSDGNIEVRLIERENAVLSIRNPVDSPANIDVNLLFERFYKADQARSKSSGLGLSIVRLLAEQMNGNVSASLQDEFLEILVEIPLYKN